MCTEFDFLNDCANYNVLTSIPTELFKVDIKTFFKIVVDKSLSSYKKGLSAFLQDSLYRKSFLANEDW